MNKVIKSLESRMRVASENKDYKGYYDLLDSLIRIYKEYYLWKEIPNDYLIDGATNFVNQERIWLTSELESPETITDKEIRTLINSDIKLKRILEDIEYYRKMIAKL